MTFRSRTFCVSVPLVAATAILSLGTVALGSCADPNPGDSPAATTAELTATAVLRTVPPDEHGFVGDIGAGEFRLDGVAAAGEFSSTSGLRPATRDDGFDGRDPRATRRAQMLDATSLMPATIPLEVVIELRHDIGRFTTLADPSLTPEERDEAITVRQSAAASITGPIRSRLEALGASRFIEFWMNPKIAATVPAGSVREILGWPEVSEVGFDRRESGPLTNYGGYETRNAMRTNLFVSQGYTGWQGGRYTGGAIRLGMIEVNFSSENYLMTGHVGFKTGGGAARIMYNGDCRTGTCVSTGGTATGETHGTNVARVLASSIEFGQDPAITNGTERIRRSGMASQSLIYYYNVAGSCSVWSAAVQKALSQGVDVLNISAWIGCSGAVGTSPCYADCDCGGLNADLDSAADNNMLVVAGSGNTGPSPVGTCGAVYPGLRRSGLTVGMVESFPLDWNYDTSPLWADSARGGMAIRLHTGTIVQNAFSIVDIVAPGDISYLYSSVPAGYDTLFGDHGTSLAAPAIAGAAGQLRQHFSATSVPANARLLLAGVGVMGDSYSADFGGDVRYGMDPRSGSGRAHMHFFSAPNLAAPFGFGWHTFTIGNGQTNSFNVGGSAAAESTQIRQWKVFLTWRETDYAAAGDIILEVWNTCPPGGGAHQLVTSDTSYDIRKRLELTQSEIGGRCLQYRVRTFSNSFPTGQTRAVTVVDYFHSGNPADH